MTDASPVASAASGRRRGGWGMPSAALLIALGAGLSAIAASGTWWRAVYPETSRGRYEVAVSGSTVLPELVPIALVVLAGVGAAIATRGTGRRLVAGLIVVAGVVITVRAAMSWGSEPAALLSDVPFPLQPNAESSNSAVVGWIVLAVAGGVLIAVGGLVLVTGAGNARGLGRRFDGNAASPAAARSPRPGPAPADPAHHNSGIPVEPGADIPNAPSGLGNPSEIDPAELWKAMDSGTDPTADEPGRNPPGPGESRSPN